MDEPKEFTIFNNYIIIPTIDLEDINDSLLRYYYKNNVEIKLRLHSKSEYEFNGKIIGMYSLEEDIKKSKKEDTKHRMNIVGEYISPRHHCWNHYYIILKDDKDNKIKLFLADIDHRTIMPKDVQAVKPIHIFEREPIPSKLRFEVLDKYSYTCQYCGRKPPEVTLEIDHLLPTTKGGKTEINNLIVSCRDCNIGKSNKVIVGW